MKLFDSIFLRRRPSVARASLIVASCAAAAAVAIGAPQRLATSLDANVENDVPHSPESLDGPDALPPSKQELVQVMIQMDAPPAAVVYGEALEAARAQAEAMGLGNTRVPMSAAQRGERVKIEIDAVAASRVANHVQTIDARQQSVLPSITSLGAEVIFRTQRAFNGIAVNVRPDQIAELAKLPGVKSVRPLAKHYPMAFNPIDFLGGRSLWTRAHANGVGLHGEGITIAVIDTGVDYVHTNFGGPGTAEAYAVSEDKDPVPNAYYPNAKFPFGYDFAGDAYTGSNTPQPDPNPMDTNSHGTACASVAAGYGVNFGGTRYVGNYDATAPDIGAMKISPGFAPLARIVPIRVFGTNGSTGLVTQAIDYAMDPNGDGDFSDHVDVVSQSIGSPNGTPDDDSAVAAANAAAAGIIMILSAGNSGDTYYITGSAGSAPGVIATAASYNDQSGYIATSSVTANSPAQIRGNKAAGVATTNSSSGTATGDIVQAKPENAATPLTNAPAMVGKLCLVAREPGLGAAAAQNCKAAGAIGVIYVANQEQANGDPFLLTTGTSTPKVPELVIGTADGTFIKNFSQFNATTGVPANPINATIQPDNVVISRSTGGVPDTMPTYSSRGPQLDTHQLKPDLTAPGEVVGVAATLTGTGAQLHNGTSSATPHVAGAAACARQLHPTWSVKEINALLMNTATHNLFTTTAKTQTHGVSRVGAGRVDFDKVSKSNTLIFNSSDPAHVSVSYGSIEVPVDGSVAISKNVTIRNKGNTTLTYDGRIDMLNTVGDANFSAPNSVVQVPAGGEVTFPMLFRATGSTLKHTRDASVGISQPVQGGNVGRHWLSEAAGYGVLTPRGGNQPVIRIPLYATVKPVSAMRMVQTTYTPTTETALIGVDLSGVRIFTGGSVPTDIVSLAKPYELQYIHPKAGADDAPTNPHAIKYVGVSSDYSSQPANNKQPTVLSFSIESFGDSAAPSFISSEKDVYIDLNFDGVDDFVLYNNSRRRTDIGTGTTHSNAYHPTLLNLKTNGALILGNATNAFPPNILDTNSFNNSNLIMNVPASLLGYTGGGQSSFQYRVVTFDRFGDFVDETPFLRYDIARPGLNPRPNANTLSGASLSSATLLEPYYFIDQPQQMLFDFNGLNYRTNRSLGLMMVHRHNGAGQRADVMRLRAPEVTSFDPNEGSPGTEVVVRGAFFGNGTGVRFSPGVNAPVRVLSSSTLVTEVPPGATTGPLTVFNAAGSVTTQEVFTVIPVAEPTPSPSATPGQSPTGRQLPSARQAQPSRVLQN